MLSRKAGTTRNTIMSSQQLPGADGLVLRILVSLARATMFSQALTISFASSPFPLAKCVRAFMYNSLSFAVQYGLVSLVHVRTFQISRTTLVVMLKDSASRAEVPSRG